MSDTNIGAKITATDNYTAAFDTLKAKIAELEGSLESLKNKNEESSKESIVSFNKMSAAGAATFTALGYAAIKAVSNYNDFEKKLNKLDVVLKATGGAVGISRKEFEALANELEDMTDITDDAVIEMATIVSSFKNISGSVAKDAIKTITQFSLTMGIDATSAAKQFGRALTDPKNNMDILKKANISFNEEETRKIVTLQQSGKLHEAQSEILKKVAGSYGTLAAFKDPMVTLAKATDDMAKSFGEKLAPVVNPIVNGLAKLAGFVGDNAKGFTALFAGLATGGAILGATAFSATALFATLAAAITLPVVAWAAGIGAAVGAVVYAFTHWDKVVAAFKVTIGGLGLIVAGFGEAWNKLVNDKKGVEAWKKTAAEMRVEMDKNLVTVGLKEAAQQKETKKTTTVVVAETKSRFQQLLEAQKGYLQDLKNNEEEEVKGYVKKYGVLSAAHLKWLMAKENMDRKDSQRELSRQIKENTQFKKYYQDKEDFEFQIKMKSTAAEQTRFNQNKKLYSEMADYEIDQKEDVFQKEKLTFIRRRIYAQSFKNFNARQIDAIIAEEDRLQQEREDNAVQSLMIDQNLGNARFEYSKGIINQLSALQSYKTREFFEVGKAASIAQATINTWEGATKALAQGGFLGPVMAAAVIAAGFAQIQNITAQNFATGGIVNGGIVAGTSYTGDKVNVGLNSREMVLNLDQQRSLFNQINRLDENRGSSNTQNSSIYNTVTHVNVTVKNGDEKTMRKVFAKLEKERNQKQQFTTGRVYAA